MRKLAVLLKRHDRRCWEIGDVVADLVGRHRLLLSVIAKAVGYSKARLSEFHLTAKTFTPAQRREGNFYDALMARRIWKAIPRLGMTPLVIRAEIMRLRGKRPRQIRVHFVQILLERERRKALTQGRKIAPSSLSLADRCYQSDWRDVIPKLPGGSVKVFLCDPPFGGYSWRGDGGYLSSRADGSGLRVDSDNNNAEEAIAVTLPLFGMCLPKLAEGGCMLLFQPGGKPDRVEVLTEAAKHGWACPFGLTWLKETPAPSDCAYPYAPTSERILVFIREGDVLQWHESGLPRADVFSFDSLTRDATRKMIQGKTVSQTLHMFQKPDALAEFLVKKHSHPGDLIVEPFGCSGTFSITAGRLGRRWLYVESNAENYRWGSRRIAEAVADLSAQAG
jgi:hypothetical protein